MNGTILDLLAQRGLKAEKISEVDGGEVEYASPCPKCGGTDRFRVVMNPREQANGHWWCRGCTKGGDIQDFLQAFGDMEMLSGVRAMKTGIELIPAERARQVEKEGWTPEHDDEHDDAELALAACYYAMPFNVDLWDYTIKPDDLYPQSWSEEGMKRSDDTIRNLVKAGALIAAEIDRLQRRAVDAGEETCQN